jgi:hypothetical protein
MRHAKQEKKKRTTIKTLKARETAQHARPLILEMMDPYWSWRFIRSCGM